MPKAKQTFDLNKKFVVLEVRNQLDFADYDHDLGFGGHYLVVDKHHIAVEKKMAKAYRTAIKECNSFFPIENGDDC